MSKTEWDLLAIHNKLHILNKTVDDLDGLRCNCPSFILRDPYLASPAPAQSHNLLQDFVPLSLHRV